MKTAAAAPVTYAALAARADRDTKMPFMLNYYCEDTG